jgi:beta-galactosidase
VIIAVAYQLVDNELIEKWKKYVEKGGNLILTCRTAHKNKNGHFFETKLSSNIASLIGAQLQFFDMLPSNVFGTIKSEKEEKEFKWNCWGEIFKILDENVEILASFSDQFYSGSPTCFTRRFGLGSITYIGVYSHDGSLERNIVRQIYQRSGIETEDLPPGVFLEFRDGFYVGVNYSVKITFLKFNIIN